MNAQLSATDYSNIAKMILANVPDQSKAFEVEAGGFRSFNIENLITVY